MYQTTLLLHYWWLLQHIHLFVLLPRETIKQVSNLNTDILYLNLIVPPNNMSPLNHTILVV